ncbi:MAG: alpha/beta fold hydrolase [Bacteroidales bacterium]
MKRISPLFLSINLIFLNFFLTASSQEPEDITIEKNSVILKGKFYKAIGENIKPVVVLLQGSPGNTYDVLGLGALLSRSGINAMTFNYSGSHQSTGAFSFPNCQSDIEATLRFLHNPDVAGKFRIDTTAIILAGYSFGGGFATTYAIKHKTIKRIISIAGVDWGIFFDQYRSDPDMKSHFDASVDNSIAAGIFRFEPGWLPKDIGSGQSILDSSYFTTRNAALLSEKDFLIICGLNDGNVTMEKYILPLYDSLQYMKARNVQLSPFEDNHTFNQSREKIAQTICDWINSTPEK